MTDLLAELLGKPGREIPPYRMMLPPGWREYDLTAGTEEQLAQLSARRLSEAGRADLAASYTQQLHDVLRSLRRQSAFAFALADEATPEWAVGPASLIGLRRRATPDITLDAVVSDAVRRHGGISLRKDRQIVRWAQDRTVALPDGGVAIRQVNYLIPIPGTRRTQAVQWTATVARDPENPQDAERIEAWTLLFDTHVATFTWSDH